MKKYLLSLIALFMVALGTKAEVVPTFSELAEGDFYLYNVEYKGFLVGANDWGTRASVSREKGLKIAISASGSNTYKLGAMSPDNAEGVWIDGSRDGNDQFTFTAGENTTYQIGCTKFEGTVLTWTGDESNTRLNFTAEATNGTWGLVTQENYDAYWQAIVDAAEAEGDYTHRMSNDKANWAGATGVYGGGAERYNEAGCPEGELLVQTITGLPAGKYEIKFNGIFNVARNLDNSVWAGDGKAYVFANGQTKDITIGTKAGLDADDWEANEHTFEVEINEGDDLKYGIANKQAAGQWAVAKAISLIRAEDPEPLVSEAALVSGGEEITLNEHAEVAVEQAEAVVAKVSMAVREANYVVRNMMMIEGEESSQWVAADIITAGAMSINGTAYAEFDQPIIFAAGSKYQVIITAKDVNEVEETATYIINGAYAEPLVSEAALVSGGEEITLNEHAEVSVEQAEAVVAKVSMAVREATCAVRNMLEITGEESSQWVAADTITVGEMSINGTAYAEFDMPILFYTGTKYMISITAKDANEVEETVSYVVNGAYEEQLESEVIVSMMEGEEEVALNSHSAVAVEKADAVKVQFVDMPNVIGATYLINEMNMNEDEEGIFWTVGKELAAGEINPNGGIAYGQFETALTFYEGMKYKVSVTAFENAADPQEIGTYTFEFIGAYSEPVDAQVIPTLIDGLTEVTLNNHSEVSVESADAMKVEFVDMPAVIGASYAINEMNMNEDEEGIFWTVGKELAVGEVSVNGIGYAEFESALTFYQGKKYQLSVTAFENAADPQEIGTYTFVFNGTYAESESTDLLVNANFAEGVVGDVNIATYAKDGEVNQMQPVPGWEFGVENGDARAAGVVAYGSATTLGGAAYTVPAAGPEGTNGNALAVVGVWTGTVKYVQDVTLPAGKYTMTVPVYNTAGTNAFVKNLIGVKYGETEVLASATSYPVGKWIDETVVFELAEETTVTVSLGYEGANVGSGASQHLFYDCVKLEAYDELAVAKKEALAKLPVADESLFTPTIADVAAIKLAIEEATTVAEVEEALAGVADLTVPALTGEYSIINDAAELFMGVNGAQPILSETETLVTFGKMEGGFSIKIGETYINMKGNDNWSMSADAEAKTAWNFTLQDGAYTIQGPKGLIGSDATTNEAPLYGNKAVANNGLWTIKENNPNKDAYEEVMISLEDLQNQFTQVYNATVNNEEYQEEKFAAVIEEMTPVLNSIQQNISTLATWAEESYNNGTMATDMEEILAGIEPIQTQLTQFLTTFNDKVANIEAMEQFMQEYESLSQQFTQVYNTTVNNEEYAKYTAVIDEMTPVLNAIQQNMAALQTWAEESYEGGTLANDLEEILSQFESIQTQLTTFLNSFQDAIEEYDTALFMIYTDENGNEHHVRISSSTKVTWKTGAELLEESED